jgi:predicted phosphodiesterase
MNKTSPRTLKVREYLKTFHDRGSLTIARVLHADYPEMFPTLENARTAVRVQRGASGKENREKFHIQENTTPKFIIPDDDNEPYLDYKINKDFERGIVLSDIHFPYHDKRALETAVQYAQNNKPDFILLNGDIVDFHQLSYFEKDPTRKNIVQELEMLRGFLVNLKTFFPKTKIIFKVGNHEERYDRYLMQAAPVLYHLPEIRLKSILKLDELGIDYVGDKRVISYRKLNIIHGHEYRFSISNPVNPARGIFLRTHKSTLAGHFHQASEHTENSIDSDVIGCWSTGCLCGLHPQWLPLNKWGHGFAEITGLKDGLWRVKNHKMVDGVLI